MDLPLEALVGSERQRQFGEAKETMLSKCCRKCEVRFA